MNRIAPNYESKSNSYNLRIFLLLCAILVFFGFIGLRLFSLQILNHTYYEALADNQHGSQTTLSAKRGEIYLTPAMGSTTPVLVATNITKNLVYVNQKQIASPDSVASKLAPLLEMAKADLVPKLKGDSVYAVLKKQLSDDVSQKITALKIPGVYLDPEQIRFYPQNDLASQVLGFVGFKGDQRVGQYGIEGEYEKELAGTAGVEGADTDASGHSITVAGRTIVPAHDGDNIFLTIDPAIQFKAQEVLDKTVKDHGADSGSVIVLDPKTGAILTMASSPGFDPNNYNKVSDISVYTNQAISAEYEPGSVFKGITMAAALDKGKVTPDTTFENAGSIQVDDKTIKNASPTEFLGTQNMITVLDESLNTGAVYAQQQIGNDTFKDYVQKFGFGQPVDIGLPGQFSGNLDNLKRKGDVFFATASFGQGITVTPIQVAQAFTAIANGGKLLKPYLVSKVVHSDGTEEDTKPSKGSQIISSQTASTLSAMLVDVVENGHGKKASVPGYYIAGKTGTAQVAFTDKVGYDPNRNIGSFVGFGPVDDPKFLMLVRIDNPKDVKFAESTAAPAFGEIASFILNYLQVPPSRQ
ncbi:MAG TPA: penicillin-binding protein 2 [Methylomirabilota bacterium]|nr:penicillin-binding protein 2 [Methylomirabilota bacterium]